ncbi:MAG: lyase family protein [Verrucomicrobiota bacterium]
MNIAESQLKLRTEQDFLGQVELPADALYGIHSLRACNNFPDHRRFHQEWYEAVGIVKHACYITYRKFKEAVTSRDDIGDVPLRFMPDEVIEALIASSLEVAEGRHFEHFLIPGVTGGAGTSINLNIDEIIANLAILKLGGKPGDYHIIDPIEHANVYQSTNDVIPTALRVAVMRLLNDLEEHINATRSEAEKLEQRYRNDLRIAYTQMQAAVPSSYGKLFSAYSDALSRDWWRISKCFERIKVVNLGGSAVGTGLTVPRFLVMEVVPQLQRLTGLPVTRSENLSDATQNLDSWVEIHAVLKAHAVNLEKIANDLRLLSADVTGKNEVSIPKKQVGSSIMPGKVNPVIPEYIISAAHKVYSNDGLITSLCGQGCLDLNAYLPVIGDAVLDSLKLLIGVDRTLRDNLLAGLTVNAETSRNELFRNPSITTALCPCIGYKKAAELARRMQEKGVDIQTANEELNIINRERLEKILEPENLLKLGFSIRDL